ncbi:MAG: T9SS type A sorting domain-containing protein [Bacteroidales bacterium]|nr:T9SS type A sorting domain-containing protein [Bacteroidales bacterium]
MKKILILGLCLWSVLFAKGQTISYEYDYDNAGNRIRSVVVHLNDRGSRETDSEKDICPLTDMMANGLTMTLYPNPTKESVRFELSGGDGIGDYVLSDITGKVIEKGYCENTHLALDLSTQKEGIYILEIFIEKKLHTYKIIKQ